ncbi:unnamed protein product [Phaeothamnion confervicola]
MTALGDPTLLRRMTAAIRELRGLFVKFDKDGDGIINRAEFKAGYEEWFRVESPAEAAAYRALTGKLDPLDTGNIDYIEWSNRMEMEDLAQITGHCRSTGPLKRSVLPPDDLERMHAMRARIGRLAEEASRWGVRLMIDAEQTYFQAAIDNTVHKLQCRFNADAATIFTTYQCYLKETPDKLATDLARAKRGGYVFAAKLVRGAYMVSEKQLAAEQGRDSPICDTIADTHQNYNRAVDQVLSFMAAEENRGEVMIATHNQESVEHTLRRMAELGIAPGSGGVYFGQLLGMADHLSFALGRAGFLPYKYIPYGKVGETIPYLLRRAQENGDVLRGSGGAGYERRLLASEVARRLLPWRR